METEFWPGVRSCSDIRRDIDGGTAIVGLIRTELFVTEVESDSSELQKEKEGREWRWQLQTIDCPNASWPQVKVRHT